jgi:hypothetical protein
MGLVFFHAVEFREKDLWIFLEDSLATTISIKRIIFSTDCR